MRIVLQRKTKDNQQKWDKIEKPNKISSYVVVAKKAPAAMTSLQAILTSLITVLCVHV